jgi:hypothetical protein
MRQETGHRWSGRGIKDSEPNGAGAKAGSLLGEKAIVSEMYGRLEVRDPPVVVSMIFVVEAEDRGKPNDTGRQTDL